MLSCCRATPSDYFDSKLLDIEAYINYKLGSLGCLKLVLLQESFPIFDVFDRNTSTKVGKLSFLETALPTTYEAVYSPLVGPAFPLCVLDISISSKKLGYCIAESLEQL
jgi:hypothetical protein